MQKYDKKQIKLANRKRIFCSGLFYLLMLICAEIAGGYFFQQPEKNYIAIFLMAIVLMFLTFLLIYSSGRYCGRTAQFLASQLQGILDNAPLAIIITDKNDREQLSNINQDYIVKSNQKIMKQAELLQCFKQKKIRERLHNIDQQILANGKAMETEIFFESDGESIYWQFNKFPLESNSKGETTLICTFIRDVSERRAIEISLKENEDTFRRLFENSSDAILLLKDGVFVECNNATLQQLGNIPKEHFIGKSPAAVSPEFQPDGQLSIDSAAVKIADAFRNGYNRFEWQHTKMDGSPFYADVSLTPIVIKGETMLHVTWRDITIHKQAEIEKDKLQMQLQQSQKMESIGRLAGGVAHDFNNMLSVIIGFADLAAKKISPADPVWQYMQEILKAGKRSVDLTRQLLAFARKQEICPVVININDSIGGMLKMLQRLIGENINLVWNPGYNLKPVKMDPSQLDQILANLAVNARDAINDSGKILIETAIALLDEEYCKINPGFQKGEFVVISICDNGCGMDKDTKNHLFEPFFTTKAIGKGTGLGLATVYGIVDQNKGFIKVYSEIGIGTTFHIYLPCDLTAEEQIVLNTVASESSLPFGDETILLVEDEPSVLFFTKQILEDLGYHVLGTDKPSEAIKTAHEYAGSIDLLLSDIIMPIMNGKELSVKINHIRPKIKKLFMSGYTANVISQHGIIADDLQFILKPFSINELAQKIRSVLDK